MDIKTLKITKPFPDFKWRWMELTPVESFNRSDIFLGITRALYHAKGLRASDSTFLKMLKVIENDLLSNSRISLTPSDPQRNVVRRHGRYWKGLGVLELDKKTREINLTPFGLKVATGVITTDQFALDRLFNHTLPNSLIDSQDTLDEWNRAGIKIKPLKLIIDILLELLSQSEYPEQAYITPNELIDVVIPMSIKIATIKISDFCDGILQYRQSPACAKHFPNCADRSNDKRMAREHLLFLKHFDVLDLVEDPRGSMNYPREKYFLGTLGMALSSGIAKSISPVSSSSISTSAVGGMPDINLGAVRAKKITAVMTRPNQAKFRKLVLGNFADKCIITGEDTKDVLDACHIISASFGGHDSVENGICLRRDIHTLFDNGKIRISKNGSITVSPDLAFSPSYGRLPKKISLPANINRDFLRRKWSYGRTSM